MRPTFKSTAVAAAALLAAVAGAQPEPGELTNILLSPQHSRWMVGSIYQLASPEEVERWLGLESDAAAERFITRFWERRDPNATRQGNEFREEYERRAEHADVVYREGTTPGRQTDRGTLYVLLGEPAKTEILTDWNVDKPAREIWIYPADRHSLDGRPMPQQYAFLLRSDGSADLLTELKKPADLPLESKGFVF